MNDRWYKNAIIYCLDVDSFSDGNGDGIGDFCGVTSKLDYLTGLGVTCLWLLPFYPSPDRDNGYDITDYFAVDKRLGDLGDFVVFIRAARDRGMRVVIDLVVNHTSIDHPWFQAAREDSRSPFRDFYIWHDNPEHDPDQVIFPGKQESLWTYDERAGSYYLHNFYAHQPDLNMKNPRVREEICRIMVFWLQLGVSGFRVDAAPYVIGKEGIRGQDRESLVYEYMTEFREFLSWVRGDAVLLAEANVSVDELQHYFGDGDRMHLLFNFLVNQHLFLALARESAEPLRRAFTDLPEVTGICQWAQFLRNHDELNLGKLTGEERDECFAKFAPEERMQLYERGVRRRLAPILEGNRERLLFAYSLLFTLPGTPVLWNGEEIGMGDDLDLPERNSIRTPMQWTDERNAGFSSAPAEKLVRPIISEGPFRYQKVNVQAQERDEESLLSLIEKMIRKRKESRAFGTRAAVILDTDPAEEVFAHSCTDDDTALIAIHNFSAREVEATVRHQFEGHFSMANLLAPGEQLDFDDETIRLTLSGYGFRWLRLHRNRP